MLKRLTLRRVLKGLARPREAARVVGHQILASLAMRFTDGLSPAPEIIVMAVSNRCNLKCRMCPQWGEHGTSNGLPAEEVAKELTVASLRAFVDEIAAAKPVIHLTGGETLLAREATDIVALLKSKGLRVSMTTNGTLLAKEAEGLVELDVDEVVVSVDGIEEVHDAIRGVPGTYGRMIEGVRALDNAKRARGAARPAVTAQITISGDNIGCLPELVEGLAAEPVDTISVHHLEFTNSDVLQAQYRAFSEQFDIDDDASWHGLPRDPEIDVSALLDAIERAHGVDTRGRELKFVPELDGQEVVSYYRDASYFPARFSDRCLFPWKGIIVYPNGDMIACPNYKVGNVAADSFGSVWSGPAYRRLRSALKRGKAFPICSRCCWFYYHSV